MDKIKELRAKIEDLVGKMKALLDLADSEKRDLTEDETKLYDGYEAESDKAQRDIDRLSKLAEREAKAAEGGDKPYRVTLRKTNDRPKEFRSIGEFIYVITYDRSDPRLQDCEYREMSMGTGNEGGFAVPEQLRPTLLAVNPQEAIFRPRCTVIPAGDPPDAKISMPTLDQTDAQNVYGGVTVLKVGEGGTKGETNVRLKDVSLEPGEVAAYITVTDKLLRNWQAAGALIGNQLRLAIRGWEDLQIYNGNGIAGPLGILSAPATIKVTRGAANTIVRADILNMLKRMKMGGSYIWVASQTTMPQLLALEDDASGAIYQFDFAKPIPASLLGIPLIYADRSVALGTTGDLILVDMQYYLLKDGSGPFVASDGGMVNFTSNKTIIKAFWNVDGKPWLTAPLPLEGSTSNTVSPFVVLASA